MFALIDNLYVSQSSLIILVCGQRGFIILMSEFGLRRKEQKYSVFSRCKIYYFLRLETNRIGEKRVVYNLG